MHLDPNGGNGIGPDATGTVYPLIAPTPEIKGVLADFYLAHANAAVILPLSLAWVSGMDVAYNDGAPTPPNAGHGIPYTPAHTADVVVVDAHNTVVFDSTTAVFFRAFPFNNRLTVYEWQSASAVCRLVQHTAVSDPSLFQARPAQIWPGDGRLDERCSEIIPTGITSLNGLTAAPILLPGYNTTLSVQTAQTGLQQVTTLTLGFEAGTGLGRSPGCTDQTVPFASLNGQTPDSNGNLTLTAGDCYYVRPVTDGSGVIPGQLAIGNDCEPCCSCADYAQLGQAIANTFAKLQALGQGAEQVACQLAKLIACWEAQKTCRDDAAIKMNALAYGAYVDVAAQFCNTGDTAVGPVVLTIAFSSTAPVALVANTSSVTDGLGALTTTTPITGTDTISFTWTSVAAGTAVVARFRLLATLAEYATATVALTASATVSGTVTGSSVSRAVEVTG